MCKRNPDLGKMHPTRRPSGRFWELPVSVEQARARVLNAMNLLEANVRDGIDVNYAQEILDEVEDDYRDMVLNGEVDEWRKTAIAAQIKELSAEIAEIQAETIVLEALRDIEDEDL